MDDVEVNISDDGRVLVYLDWLKQQISILYANVESIEANARQQEAAFSPPPPPAPPIRRPPVQQPRGRPAPQPPMPRVPMAPPPIPPYAEQYAPGYQQAYHEQYGNGQEPFTPDLPEGLQQPPPRAAQKKPESEDQALFGE